MKLITMAKKITISKDEEIELSEREEEIYKQGYEDGNNQGVKEVCIAVAISFVVIIVIMLL